MMVPEEVSLSGSDELLLALAEQLKLPLLHISQHVELARAGNELRPEHVEHVADMALQMIDSYILSRQLTLGQTRLNLEPVSVSSVLQEAAHRLSKISKEYGCDLELRISGRYGPVMAHRQGLESGIVALGYSFIEAQQSIGEEKPRLMLAAHKNSLGIVAGVYGDHGNLTADMLRRACLLYGRAKQAVPSLSHGAGASIFIADSLLGAMDSKLYVSRYNKLTGLAAALIPNPQLQLV